MAFLFSREALNCTGSQNGPLAALCDDGEKRSGSRQRVDAEDFSAGLGDGN